MTGRWLVPDAVFDGARLRTDRALRIEGGVVRAIVPASDAPAGAERRAGIVSPGFIDLQVNGGGGVLLNADPTPAAMRQIAAAHRSLGTAGLMPTVITDAPQVLAAAADAALAARGAPGVLGLHIEGPHIAEARKGTHAARHIRPLDADTIGHVARLRAADVPVMITLAPEAARPEQVAALADTGAVVSIGHTDASAEACRAMFAAGACAATHLFNAMSPMAGRAPGAVGAVINSDAYAGIIVDGIHVADEMVALAIRARPVPDRMFLVSDAMPTVAGPDSFALYGQSIHLSEGRLVNAAGSLAGAHLSMAGAVHRLVNAVGIAPEQALRMAVTVPARLIGQDALAQVEGRALRDLVLLSPQMAFDRWLAEAPPGQSRAIS